MNDNIKIFKSKSYQKILKAVLKFRYPKLSYEEALIEERLRCECLFLHKTKNMFGLNLPDITLTRSDCESGNEWFHFEEENASVKELQSAENYICLGRPITICELVNVLLKITNTDYIFYGSVIQSGRWDTGRYGVGWVFDSHKTIINFVPKTYYLHEQTQKTINKIAKLLD